MYDDENYMLPDRIIENGYKSYQDPETGMIFTEYDIASFALRAADLGMDKEMFLVVPFVYTDEDQKKLVWEKIIQPHMADPDRILLQDIMDRNLEISKQRYLEAISYIPEVNRVKT